MMALKRACLFLLLSLAGMARAETPNPLEIFVPVTLPQGLTAARAPDGVPGPGYWQNRADYEIRARIDPATHSLSATEIVTYTNNSPEALDVLWLQLDQNIYRPDSRRHFLHPRDGAAPATDGYQLDRVAVEAEGQTVPAVYLVSDTRMQIRLATPLAAMGRVIRLHLDYHYQIPGTWGGRTAVTPSEHGEIYEIAQWFPRMAVYDDLKGWNTAPYLGSEFYLDYGNIDYAVTVPWDYLVAGSGALINPEEVLTAEQRRRLAQAEASDATLFIRKPKEVGDPASRPTNSGTKTWHFRMAQTRDVAFTASPAFIWDAARINLPEGRHALAMSVYPAEAKGWARSTEYVKAALEGFSARWYPYPWPVMVNLGGHGAGMEYPGIVFDGMNDAGKGLYWITTHEVGHSYFPMIVGSNERTQPWMDEGFNTFIDVYAQADFNHGEYAPKRDSEYAEGGGNPVDEILPVLADPNAPSILTAGDLVSETWRHKISYFKPALGLVLLREQILGPDRFDQAFRRYIAAWAFKHPAPSDFFRLMESEAGEDLSWFWRGWYLHNWSLDLGLTKAIYAHDDPAKGIVVDLVNLDRLILPAVLELSMADGTSQRITVPIESWMQSNRLSLHVPTTGKVRAVTLDPDHVLPDRDRSNNRLELP